MMDCSSATITGVFYLVFSRDWFTIYLIHIIMSVSALVLAFICPESPRWLLYNGRTDEAIEAINYIAKFNGSSEKIPLDATFEESLQLAAQKNTEEAEEDDQLESKAIGKDGRAFFESKSEGG